MTKKDFLALLAEKMNMTHSVADFFLDSFIEAVHEVLKSDDDINLPGLGKFEVKDRAARKGRNPKTGEIIRINAKKTPRFRPSSTLINLLNNQDEI